MGNLEVLDILREEGEHLALSDPKLEAGAKIGEASNH